MKRIIPTLALAVALPLAACSEESSSPLGLPEFESTLTGSTASADRGPAPGEQPIAAIAIDNGNFTQLVAALGYVDEELDAGLVDLFSTGKDQYTVFAPTDEAFDRLYDLLNSLELDFLPFVESITDVPAPVVLDVLLYHVTDGRRAANSVLPRRGVRLIETLKGESFRVTTEGKIIDGLSGPEGRATILTPDVSASNGIIHVIDEVIVPPTVVELLTGERS